MKRRSLEFRVKVQFTKAAVWRKGEKKENVQPGRAAVLNNKYENRKRKTNSKWQAEEAQLEAQLDAELEVEVVRNVTALNRWREQTKFQGMKILGMKIFVMVNCCGRKEESDSTHLKHI